MFWHFVYSITWQYNNLKIQNNWPLLYTCCILNCFTAWWWLVWKAKTYFFFLIIKPTRCTNFSNLFLKWNSTCFGQFLCPSSGVFHHAHINGICHTGLLTACEQDQDGTALHPDPARKLEFFTAHTAMVYVIQVCWQLASCRQTCMTYTIAVCAVRNSWWWTEELSDTCRVSFQE